MKYIFFGTPEFAAIILERLIKAGWPPAAVVTNPDKPVGRKKILTPPPVKQIFASSEEANIWQPEDLLNVSAQGGSASGGKSQLSKVNALVGILAAYGKIIPKEIIDIFPKGIIVVHPSLLPKYRGPTPIQTAILNGDKETGVTLFLMDEKIDHGSIISNFPAFAKASAGRQFPISNDDDYETLMKKLAEASADLLIETLPKYLAGGIKPRPQDEAGATYTKKFTMEEARVDLEKDDPEMVVRKVKALNPEPGVWTIKNGKRMKILEADLVDGRLVLKKIQFAGEKSKPPHLEYR